MRPSARDMTSIRLAVKLAMYSTWRDSSSAMSEACPPIATTFPTVAVAHKIGMVQIQSRLIPIRAVLLRLTFADITFPLPYDIFLTPNA